MAPSNWVLKEHSRGTCTEEQVGGGKQQKMTVGLSCVPGQTGPGLPGVSLSSIIYQQVRPPKQNTAGGALNDRHDFSQLGGRCLHGPTLSSWLKQEA